MFQEQFNRQDESLDHLSTTLKKLKLIGHQMSDHLEMEEPLLDDLHRSIDRTNDKVSRATKKTDNLMKLKSNDCCNIL